MAEYNIGRLLNRISASSSPSMLNFSQIGPLVAEIAILRSCATAHAQYSTQTADWLVDQLKRILDHPIPKFDNLGFIRSAVLGLIKSHCFNTNA